MHSQHRYSYFCNCVGWDSADVDCDGGLCDLINDRIEITRETFLKHVSHDELSEIAETMGYFKHPSQGLTMAGDYHIEYFRSRHHGERVYGFRHSAIEYVFKAA